MSVLEQFSEEKMQNWGLKGRVALTSSGAPHSPWLCFHRAASIICQASLRERRRKGRGGPTWPHFKKHNRQSFEKKGDDCSEFKKKKMSSGLEKESTDEQV